MNYFDWLPEELIDMIFFQSHKTKYEFVMRELEFHDVRAWDSHLWELVLANYVFKMED